MSGSLEQANKMLENSNIEEVMKKLEGQKPFNTKRAEKTFDNSNIEDVMKQVHESDLLEKKPTREDIEQKILTGRKAEQEKRNTLASLI